MLWPRVTKMTLPPACATATPSGFTRTLTPKLLPCAGGALTCAKELYAQVPEMLEANYKYMSKVAPREKRLRCDIAFPFWDDADGAELRERMHRQFGFEIEAAPEFFNLYFHHYPFNA